MYGLQNCWQVCNPGDNSTHLKEKVNIVSEMITVSICRNTENLRPFNRNYLLKVNSLNSLYMFFSFAFSVLLNCVCVIQTQMQRVLFNENF